MSSYKIPRKTILIVSIVVISIITSIILFELLLNTPDRWRIPEPCLASAGFSCDGVKPVIVNKDIIVHITNYVGYTITLPLISDISKPAVNTLNCTKIYFCSQKNTTCTDTSIILNDGDGTTIRLENCDFSNQSSVKGYISISIPYKNAQNNLPETLMISVR